MRDFHLPGRSAAFAHRAMAATSHPLATLTALDMLRAGGNAVDAAIAAAAVLNVVEPAMTGIGGDCFALLAPASGGVVAMNGSGRAPAAATPERLRAAGVTGGIEAHSPHAVTVPGAVAGWAKLVAEHGTKSLEEILRPAIGYAEEGYPVMPRVAHDWQENASALHPGAAGPRIYLPGGRAPAAGDRVRLPQLAATLRRIGKDGPDAYYKGELAARMVATLRSLGGLHTEEDFAAASAEMVEPLHRRYRDVELYECPPNGQGLVALMMLNILEGYDLAGLDPLGARRFHLEAEATRLAFRDRDAFLADPAFADVPVAKLLDPAYGAKLRQLIDPTRAMGKLPPPLLEGHPDTTYLTVVDRDLNAVSFINSLFDGFGSGIACAETGVLFHDRGRAFRLDPTHPNVIAPGKRPMHTIIPGMVMKDGAAWMSFGVMGGQYQPVGQTHVLTHIVDWGMDPQTALDLPRALAYPGPIELERGISASLQAELRALGHETMPATAPLGGGQAIRIDRERGVLIGGSDPRKDGLALGY